LFDRARLRVGPSYQWRTSRSRAQGELQHLLLPILNGELMPHLVQHGSFDIDSARRYGAQIIDTIDFMHERGVIHR
jgi:serine/threonine protein kinase